MKGQKRGCHERRAFYLLQGCTYTVHLGRSPFVCYDRATGYRHIKRATDEERVSFRPPCITDSSLAVSSTEYHGESSSAVTHTEIKQDVTRAK